MPSQPRLGLLTGSSVPYLAIRSACCSGVYLVVNTLLATLAGRLESCLCADCALPKDSSTLSSFSESPAAAAAAFRLSAINFLLLEHPDKG